MKRLSSPILFLAVLLLLSVAFARELEEKRHEKEPNVNDVYGDVKQWGGPGWGGRPGWGGGPGGGGGPGWGGGPGRGGGPGWGGGPGGGGGPGWGGGYCRYRCGYYGRCCSAEEFAEFIQAQGIPQN